MDDSKLFNYNIIVQYTSSITDLKNSRSFDN